MNENNNKRAIALAFGLGMELLAMVLGGIFLGYFIGQSFHQQNIGAVLGCFVGFTLWIWKLIKSKRYII